MRTGTGTPKYTAGGGSPSITCAWESAYGARRLVRPKEEWAGISLTRAYDTSTAWPYRREAQMRFNARVRRMQCAVRRFRGLAESPEREFDVKPQLAAFYTSYPSPATAAIAHTGFLELKSLTKALRESLQETCEEQALVRYPECAQKPLKAVVAQVATALAHRTMLEEAGRAEGLACLQHYRLFQASQNGLRFRRVEEIIEAVVLFGDILPPVESMDLDPIAARILARLSEASGIYYEMVPRESMAKLPGLFTQWAIDLVDALAPMLPVKENEQPAAAAPQSALSSETDEAGEGAGADFRYNESAPPQPRQPSQLPPLDKPQPPALTAQGGTPENAMRDVLESMLAREEAGKTGGAGDAGAQSGNTEDGASQSTASPQQELEAALGELRPVAAGAAGQTSEWEDPREDIVEQEVGANTFTQGPMEGTPTEGETLKFSLDGTEVGGELKNRAVVLSEDAEAVERLRQEATPMSRELARNLYPSIDQEPRLEFLHTSGQLDPRRLPVAEISEASFRRHPIQRRPSTRGRSVVLIAADGSASLNDRQMRACKVMTSAWLESAHHGNVQVMAALYNSEGGFFESDTPLVQWIFHPGKTAVPNPAEAVRAVAALPDNGVGAQADALSLQYMVDEAGQVARGCNVYLVLISDCSWNRCFHTLEKSPEQEVASVLGGFQERLQNRLHITLVALGNPNQEVLDSIIDKKLVVTRTELEQPAEVAKKTSDYVAACIRERRRHERRRA